MQSIELRQKFIDYFKSKDHRFQSSSSIVIKDDPTLLFVNAGMNQFKDIFLGTTISQDSKLVNSQKCLRVSGKHNDLEEVGYDTYHHTMFEMLGNWSFGDYFKKEAIHLAWDFLTNELEVPKTRLYVTYFQGDEKDELDLDIETKNIWKNLLSSDKIIAGAKKDNFWEMGKIGPCGPSTEIHIDLRSDSERKKIKTQDLINKDHPQVIEIWNIVFIEFNRNEKGLLGFLPKKHVDTGMGFERLCMIMQGKNSTYDTDLFSNLISTVCDISKINYGENEKTDIAIRVIVDHVRAIGFSIADGQLPSNTGAGYVIRRILRRAVRYGYTHLSLKKPFLYKLIDSLSEKFQAVFPEISEQKSLIENVVKQEEKMFLQTLGKGLDLINQYINLLDVKTKEVSGKAIFELYDTYGFPPDLTALILKEKGLGYNQLEFEKQMEKQKNRSRSASEIILGDWVQINDLEITGFIGYDYKEHTAKIVKYRKVTIKGEVRFHVVFDKTPFYPEGGGQIGDTGVVLVPEVSPKLEQCFVLDTKKENNIILHILKTLPNLGEDLSSAEYMLIPDHKKRRLITRNHSATHLLHHELRKMLGNHVEQKGSYVGVDYLRFDFSHFEKLTKNQVLDLEKNVNNLIAAGFDLEEFRDLPIQEAREMGAIALFGEKYGDYVRTIKFSDSVEFCGGTHVKNTAEIGLIKIISESSIASGIRRVEAVTSQSAVKFLNKKLQTLNQVENLFKNSSDILNSVTNLINEHQEFSLLAANAQQYNSNMLREDLEKQIVDFHDLKILFSEVDTNPSTMKNICFSFIKKYDNILLALATKVDGKVILNIALSKPLIKSRGLDASKIIYQINDRINGKGGGQAFFAVSSGDNVAGVKDVFNDINNLIKES